MAAPSAVTRRYAHQINLPGRVFCRDGHYLHAAVFYTPLAVWSVFVNPDPAGWLPDVYVNTGAPPYAAEHLSQIYRCREGLQEHVSAETLRILVY